MIDQAQSLTKVVKKKRKHETAKAARLTTRDRNLLNHWNQLKRKRLRRHRRNLQEKALHWNEALLLIQSIFLTTTVKVKERAAEEAVSLATPPDYPREKTTFSTSRWIIQNCLQGTVIGAGLTTTFQVVKHLFLTFRIPPVVENPLVNHRDLLRRVFLTVTNLWIPFEAAFNGLQAIHQWTRISLKTLFKPITSTERITESTHWLIVPR